MQTIRIDERRQGPTGSGQGGWTARQLVAGLAEPATVAITAPIPLDVDLVVRDHPDGSRTLLDPRSAAPAPILRATPWEPAFAETDPVTIAAARDARGRFERTPADHPVPLCFSCGVQHDSMQVHAGPLGDGRYATDWTVPDWAVSADGTVDEGVLWAAIDCCAAWFVCMQGGERTAFTVQLAVEVLEPLQPATSYSLVGWGGDWDGRKRSGASAAFAADGTLVARSSSFWVAV